MAQTIPGNSNTVFTQATPADLAVSLRTLETYQGRAFQFITALTRDEKLVEELRPFGYDAGEHDEGLRRLNLTLGLGEAQRKAAWHLLAMTEIDNPDEGIFRIVSAMLTRRFPAEAEELLRGIGPGQGMAAVLNLEILIQRIDALEAGVGREATRERDQQIVEMLAKRGLDKTARENLKAQIVLAKQVAPGSTSATEKAAAERAYVEQLVSLGDWLLEWSEIAKQVIKRRDQLIRLGLASRRGPNGEDVPEPEPTPAPAPPPEPGPFVPTPGPTPAPAPSPSDDPFGG